MHTSTYDDGLAKTVEANLCNFGPTHTPARGHMWDGMKDWLLKGAIETDEKMTRDLAGPGYHINRSNLLVIESKADMQKRGQASPDDEDALPLTFAKAVAPAEKERERDEDEYGYGGSFNGPGAWNAMSPSQSCGQRFVAAPHRSRCETPTHHRVTRRGVRSEADSPEVGGMRNRRRPGGPPASPRPDCDLLGRRSRPVYDKS